MDGQGRTLLHLAAQYANENFVRMLRKKGIDPTTQDKQDQTVLHAAEKNADIAVFSYLIQEFVNQPIVHAVDCAGNNIVHKAAYAGNLEVLILCLEYELDFLVRNHQGQTALDIAQQMNHPQEVIEAIEQGMRWGANNLQEDQAQQEAAIDLEKEGIDEPANQPLPCASPRPSVTVRSACDARVDKANFENINSNSTRTEDEVGRLWGDRGQDDIDLLDRHDYDDDGDGPGAGWIFALS